MKVELDFEQNLCTVIREDKDSRIYKESLLYHLIKKEILKQGYDVIKKLMWKDGHLVDEGQFYIRERKWKWCFSDLQYCTRRLQEDYNKGGCTLHIHSGEDWR